MLIHHLRRAAAPVAWRATVPTSGHACIPSARQLSSASQFDGEIAELYGTFFERGEPMWQHTVSVVRSLNDNPGRILDLASGPGEPACSLAKAFPFATVLCTDNAAGMIAQAQRRAADLRSVHCVTLDMCDLAAVAPWSQDLVTVQFGLMFASDLGLALRHIHQALKPGGHLVATVWSEMPWMAIIEQAMSKATGGKPPAQAIDPLSLRDQAHLDSVLTAAGFTFGDMHNDTGTFTLDVGPASDDASIAGALLPVLSALETEDARSSAIAAMREETKCFVDGRGHIVLPTMTYRYVVAMKPARG